MLLFLLLPAVLFHLCAMFILLLMTCGFCKKKTKSTKNAKKVEAEVTKQSANAPANDEPKKKTEGSMLVTTPPLPSSVPEFPLLKPESTIRCTLGSDDSTSQSQAKMPTPKKQQPKKPSSKEQQQPKKPSSKEQQQPKKPSSKEQQPKKANAIPRPKLESPEKKRFDFDVIPPEAINTVFTSEDVAVDQREKSELVTSSARYKQSIIEDTAEMLENTSSGSATDESQQQRANIARMAQKADGSSSRQRQPRQQSTAASDTQNGTKTAMQ